MMDRRKFLSTSMLAGAAVAATAGESGKTNASDKGIGGPEQQDKKLPITIFSKNLQWLDLDGMAQAAAEIGFDGVDLTVRPGGHVLPERVAEDLPRADEAVRKAGLKIYSIVTSIENADDRVSEKILQSCKKLGIGHYRLGWFHYEDGMSIEQNLKRITEKVRQLEALNSQYQIHGSYQNHSGKYFGAAVWDLAQVLKSVEAKWTGSQYDIYHAMIEGANSWMYGLEMLAPFIKTLAIKDFAWEKKNASWHPESCPLGEGMVDFKAYLGFLKKSGIRAPISVHYEYELGGADQGMKTITVSKDEVFRAMKKDLTFLKTSLASSGLAN